MSTLSLAELETYDPRAPQRPSASAARERRFLCPLCGDGKPRDAAHRSLTANMESGAWNCKRCKAAGKLKEFWQDRPKQSRAVRVRGSLRKTFASLPTASAPAASDSTQWREQLKTLAPLGDTAGQEYLQKRGIAPEVAQAAGARFSPNFFGRAAVVFPIRDRARTLVAATARYIDGRADPKARTTGHKREGVFFAPACVNGRAFTPLDKSTPAIIVCEAPIDALSLASVGFRARALCGTSAPDWLRAACGFRRVLLAFDGDLAGDNAAGELSGVLSSFGASCERLRPTNAKDWNEWLCNFGAAALEGELAARVLMDEAAFEATGGAISIFD